MHLSSVLIQWITFMRILMITAQAGKEKYYLFLTTWSQTLWQLKKISSHNQRIVYYMEKTKYFTCFYHTVLFFCSKKCQIKLTHYLIMKKNNRKELRNIAINHSAYIDYKDFLEIYRECTKEPYSFLTLDTSLPASNPLRFRKKLFDSL